MFVQILAIAAAALAGAVLPLVGRRSQRTLHLIVALATGIFLGIVFLHLLPEMARVAGQQADGGSTIWLPFLIGVLGLYLLEKLVLPGHDGADPHVAVGWGSCFGLSVHAFTSGLGFAAVAESTGLEGSVFLSIVIHKLAEGFSLATVLLLSGLARRKIVLSIAIFALITPAGLVCGRVLFGQLAETSLQVITALATGTFLFVALCDLLPESFHERRDTGLKLGLLLAGILASLTLGALDG